MSQYFTKKPSEVLDFTLDWSDWLDGEPIASATWTTGALTKASQSEAGPNTTVYLSGGTQGAFVAVTCAITTATRTSPTRTLYILVDAAGEPATLSPDRVLPSILPQCTGVPTPLVIQTVIDTAAEFCRRSRLWKLTLPAIALTDGQSVVELAVPANASIVTVERARLSDGSVLKGTDEATAAYLEEQDASEPRYLQCVGAFATLLPALKTASARSLIVKAVLAPTLDATALPGVLEPHMDALAEGAKAALYLDPNKPWSAPQLATICQANFDRRIDDARIAAFKGGVTQATYVRGVRFGR